jgi:hypothetical protein
MVDVLVLRPLLQFPMAAGPLVALAMALVLAVLY